MGGEFGATANPLGYLQAHLFQTQPHPSILAFGAGVRLVNLMQTGTRISVRLAAANVSAFHMHSMRIGVPTSPEPLRSSSSAMLQTTFSRPRSPAASLKSMIRPSLITVLVRSRGRRPH